MTRDGARGVPRGLLFVPAGFAIWGVAFGVIYGTQGLGCALAWQDMPVGPASLLRVVLVAELVLTLVVIGWVWRLIVARRHVTPERGRTERFLRWTGGAGAVAALAATALTFAPATFATLCVPN